MLLCLLVCLYCIYCLWLPVSLYTYTYKFIYTYDMQYMGNIFKLFKIPYQGSRRLELLFETNKKKRNVFYIDVYSNVL